MESKENQMKFKKKSSVPIRRKQQQWLKKNLFALTLNRKLLTV